MFFKNLSVFKFTKPMELDSEVLNEQLKEVEFKECHSQQLISYGFVPPLGSENLVHVANGCMLVAMKIQEKVIPTACINEELNDRIEIIKVVQGRKVSRKERQDMKDEVLMGMLPTALKKSHIVYAYIDAMNHYIAVDTSSGKRADELIDLLRNAMGSVPVVPMHSENVSTKVMTRWVSEQSSPDGFSFGSSFKAGIS